MLCSICFHSRLFNTSSPGGFFVPAKDMGKAILIKLNKVVGYYYPADKPNKLAMVSILGAPGFGDTGSSGSAKTANKLGVSVFKPDYIGMCRSDGQFSFKNCVETIYESLDFLTGKITALNAETGKKYPKQSYKQKDVIVQGTSFGGTIAPFIDKYKKTAVKYVILASPVTDWKKLNQKENIKAEDPEIFNNIVQNGMANIYRGYANSEFPEIVRGKSTEFNPMDNTDLLKDKKVYILHGNKDKSINWKMPYEFYKKLEKENKTESVYWKLLKNHGHTPAAVKAAIKHSLSLILKEQEST